LRDVLWNATSGSVVATPAEVIKEWNDTHDDPWPFSVESMRRIVLSAKCENGFPIKRLPNVEKPLKKGSDAEKRWAWCTAQVPHSAGAFFFYSVQTWGFQPSLP